MRRKFCNELQRDRLTFNSRLDTPQTVHGIRVTKAKIKSFCRDRTARVGQDK